MSQYKAYPAYKDSGVEWIGQVPEHWEIPALKFLVSTPITDGPHETPVPADPQDGVLFISAEAVSSGNINFSKAWGYISQADHKRYSRKYKPQKDDIYMVKSGATTGVTAIVEDIREFNIWSPLAAIRTNPETIPKFLLYALRSTEFQAGVVLNWSYGTQQNIGMNVLENLPLPTPPQKEQAAIAATLDRETARIEALVKKKTRFIELLKEKRQALITHAVTKGLDPNVKMMDSGVEWIGQVPEHWEVARLKRLASLRNERRSDVSADITYIGLEDVEAASGRYRPTNGSSRQSEDSTVGIFYEGDVLYGKLRPYLRKAIVATMDGCCSTEFLVLRTKKVEPRWLQEWLLTPDVTHQIESGCEGAKMPRADWWHVGSIETVYPDLDEQAQIIATLDRETARIDALVAKAEQSITLLKERRAAFITAAVTGQIDLRGEQ